VQFIFIFQQKKKMGNNDQFQASGDELKNKKKHYIFIKTERFQNFQLLFFFYCMYSVAKLVTYTFTQKAES
jgi:hypothetical protein